MANKEALRELQQRLAHRMHASRDQPDLASWLAVECAGQSFLLSLKQAAEIFAPQPIQQVPHSTPWLLGVANLRGGLHTVVDLAAFLGLRASARHDGAGLPAVPAQQARFIAFNPDLNVNAALQVDRLLGLRSAEQFTPWPDDEGSNARPRFAAQRLRDERGQLWQVLDLEALTRHEVFLNIVG
ncbi:MAG: chemotaxis protein CheW [Burkholderiaceae bacterium]|nr:chemotaxis protein CheW [Roseateles sp.]MBV8469837.1 chemotaxis protein CheW [Burkholderiaceae bacterium]